MTKHEYLKKALQATKDGVMPSFEMRDGDVVCLYRGPNGRRCVAGLALPDDKYEEWMENQGVSHRDLWQRLDGIVDGLSQAEMVSLQQAHDQAAENVAQPFPVTFVRELKKTEVWSAEEIDAAVKEVDLCLA